MPDLKFVACWCLSMQTPTSYKLFYHNFRLPDILETKQIIILCVLWKQKNISNKIDIQVCFKIHY